MTKLIWMLKEKRMLIAIIIILFICSVAIALGVYAQITHRKQRMSESEKIYANYEVLKTSFQEIFTNTINKELTANRDINYDELLTTAHHIKEEKAGKYKVEAYYPKFKENSKVLKEINNDIYNKFGKEMLKIANDTKINTNYSLNYTAYVNGDIFSLVIMCKYKDGEKAQRKIVYCYNYDVKNDKLLTIDDLLNYKNLNKTDVQKKITQEIKTVNDQTKSMKNQGYNVYIRDEESDIYKVENTPNFFLGKNGYLYLVYAYGNNTYTSEIDLIVF